MHFLPRQQRHIDQHILGEDAVARRGIVDQHVRHRAHELAILNDRAARQECGGERTNTLKNIISHFHILIGFFAHISAELNRFSS